MQMAVVQPVFAAGMAALAATGANAQTIDQAPIDDDIFGPFELSPNIALVSDYRGRGVSYYGQLHRASGPPDSLLKVSPLGLHPAERQS